MGMLTQHVIVDVGDPEPARQGAGLGNVSVAEGGDLDRPQFLEYGQMRNLEYGARSDDTPPYRV